MFMSFPVFFLLLSATVRGGAARPTLSQTTRPRPTQAAFRVVFTEIF